MLNKKQAVFVETFLKSIKGTSKNRFYPKVQRTPWESPWNLWDGTPSERYEPSEKKRSLQKLNRGF